MSTLRWSERSGSSRANEDRIFIGDQFAMVLDGASRPGSATKSGGWLASTLGSEIHARLGDDREGSLSDIVAACITAVAQMHQLVPGDSPSTTLAIVTWRGPTVETFVLGDSPVVVEFVDGQLELVRDDRLDAVAIPQRLAMTEAASREGFGMDHLTEWSALVDAQREARNRKGGYWIAEASPEAAYHAVQRTWPIEQVAGILAVSDGVSAGVDTYKSPPTWTNAVAIARRDPGELLATVHTVEEGDHDGRQWPRNKRHDDKAAIFVDLR